MYQIYQLLTIIIMSYINDEICDYYFEIDLQFYMHMDIELKSNKIKSWYLVNFSLLNRYILFLHCKKDIR